MDGWGHLFINIYTHTHTESHDVGKLAECAAPKRHNKSRKMSHKSSARTSINLIYEFMIAIWRHCDSCNSVAHSTFHWWLSGLRSYLPNIYIYIYRLYALHVRCEGGYYTEQKTTESGSKQFDRLTDKNGTESLWTMISSSQWEIIKHEPC